MRREVFQVESEHLCQPFVVCIFCNDDFGSWWYWSVSPEFIGFKPVSLVHGHFVVASCQWIRYLCFDRLLEVQTLSDAEYMWLALLHSVPVYFLANLHCV